MPKIATVQNAGTKSPDILFYCPGCDSAHGINSRTWTFNGDLERPTISPSVFVNAGRANPDSHQCHSFVENGMIRFLSDCSHQLAGKTVEIPEWEAV